MMRRVIALIAIVCFAVLPAINAAHATALTAEALLAKPVAHAAHAMHAPAADHVDCEAGPSCASGDADGCAAACSALLGHILLLPPGGTGAALSGPRLVLPDETVAVGQVPGLSERPPKSFLL